MLTLEDVYASYGPINVLQGLSLRVEPGQVVAILGRNGMGKTTALRTIIGLNRPHRGRITFKAVDISRAPAHRIAAMGVGYVPQGRRIFPSLSVLENLQVAARQRPPAQWNLPKILDLFPNLHARQGQRANKLSGGEQQMLAVARALVSNPELLLMDEPTEGLAPLFVQKLARIVGILKQQGSSILLVEQHVAFAVECADYVYLLNKGKIVEGFGVNEFRDHDQVRKLYLGV